MAGQLETEVEDRLADQGGDQDLGEPASFAGQHDEPGTGQGADREQRGERRQLATTEHVPTDRDHRAHGGQRAATKDAQPTVAGIGHVGRV